MSKDTIFMNVIFILTHSLWL